MWLTVHHHHEARLNEVKRHIVRVGEFPRTIHMHDMGLDKKLDVDRGVREVMYRTIGNTQYHEFGIEGANTAVPFCQTARPVCAPGRTRELGGLLIWKEKRRRKDIRCFFQLRQRMGQIERLTGRSIR